MGIVAFAFIVIFLLIASGGLLLFYREAMVQRVGSVVSPTAEKPQRSLLGTLQQSKASIGEVVGHFDRIVPKSPTEISVTQKRLTRAGYRSESAVRLLFGAKVLVPLLLCFLVVVTGLGKSFGFFAYAMALGLGYLAPDFWLGRRIKARQARIRRGLPDVLDLMVVCIEAGLSLDQATMRTGEELRISHPDISDEIGVLVLEQRAGRARAEAWKNFADRTDVDSVRNLVSVLVQSEQFGTSIAKTLRVHADTLRTQRRQTVEEKAAKTTVKLVFPLVLFIFPSLFLVTLGPAAIIMAESFQKYFTH